MGNFQLNYEVKTKDVGKILRSFLKEQNISKKALTEIKFHGGQILVNGEEKNVRTLLQPHDKIQITFPEERRSPDMVSRAMDLDILFEDDALMVLNKPCRLPTIPSILHPNFTLANGVLHYYDRIGLESTFHGVNRLDRDTSGALIIAKHSHIHHLFSQQQKVKSIVREYLAIVSGEIAEDCGCIVAPIGRKPTSIIEREVREDGQYAKTNFTVVEKANGYTLVKLRLETGRTHQIRVHMAHIGHPLVGDDLYGGSVEKLGRQALHSQWIHFNHPLTNEEMSFEAPLPLDMVQFIQNELKISN